MSTPESNWKEWIRKADADILCIRNNVGANEVPWDAVCFHAYQAAERMLQAFLVFRLKKPRRGQDLLVLLDECVAIDDSFVMLKPACERLNALAVEVPYPGGLEEQAEADGLQAAGLAAEVRRAVVAHFPSDENDGP